MSIIWLSVDGLVVHFFFFFQAEDGIRDLTVTGVQTCALPISPAWGAWACRIRWPGAGGRGRGSRRVRRSRAFQGRSEERRVGKGVDLGGRRIIKKKNKKQIEFDCVAVIGRSQTGEPESG